MPSGSHDINVKLLALTGIVSAVLVYSLIVATQAWFRYEFQQENQRKYIDVPYAELAELQASQQAALNADPHYADPEEKDRVIIPIDMAMRGVVQKYAKTQSKAQ
jgi:hypothetical protein